MLKRLVERVTGYWVYRARYLPIGADLRIDLVRRGLSPSVIYDVGANTGQTYRRFRRDFPDARIHCFEPVRSTYAQLERAIAGDALASAHLLAFSNSTGESVIYTHATSSVLNSLRPELASGPGSETVRTSTIDDFATGRIDLIKIDTEGFELPVLHGAELTLRDGRIGAVLAEVGFTRDNTRNTYFGDVTDLLSSTGYRFFGLYDVAQYPDVPPFANALYLPDWGSEA
jgi:FkbM family methyltransferase